MFNRKSLTQRELSILNDRVNQILDNNELIVDKHYTFTVVQGIALNSREYTTVRDNRLSDNRKV